MGTVRAVVADDDPDLRLLLRATLARSGGVVVGEAATAAEALEVVGTEQPDLVLVELRFRTGEDGLWLLPRLAAVAPAATLVVVTNDRRAEIWDEATDLGAAAVLSKGDAFAWLPQVLERLAQGRTGPAAVVDLTVARPAVLEHPLDNKARVRWPS